MMEAILTWQAKASISRIGRSFLETLDVVRGLQEECGVIV
jgi:hypothetical protein